jgi:hypothetical protein
MSVAGLIVSTADLVKPLDVAEIVTWVEAVTLRHCIRSGGRERRGLYLLKRDSWNAGAIAEGDFGARAVTPHESWTGEAKV